MSTQKPTRLRTLATTAASIAALALVALSSGCLANSAEFVAGDCVTIASRVVDSTLHAAECDDAVGTFQLSERTYRVDSVLPSTGGGCPALRGFFPVEFVHEPNGVTYCLVQADGSR